MIGVDRQQRSETLDSHWLEILFFLIGEDADDHAHQVNGAEVNVRSKGDKLAVWVTDSANTEAVMKIGKMVKERLEIPENQTIVFNVHKEEKTRPGGNGRGWRYQRTRPLSSMCTRRRKQDQVVMGEVGDTREPDHCLQCAQGGENK